MALELLKITGSQPYYLNNASTAEELTIALEDFMRTGTQIIFQHDGDDCILASFEYKTGIDSTIIAYFVTPKKKLLKVDIGAGWDLVITESEFTPETDTTLTQSGKPADAKEVGTALGNKANKTDLNNYASKTDLNSYATKTELNSYATKTYVDEAVENSGGGIGEDVLAMLAQAGDTLNKVSSKAEGVEVWTVIEKYPEPERINMAWRSTQQGMPFDIELVETLPQTPIISTEEALYLYVVNSTGIAYIYDGTRILSLGDSFYGVPNHGWTTDINAETAGGFYCVRTNNFATEEYVNKAIANNGGGGASGGGASGGLSIKKITFTDRPSTYEWLLNNADKVIKSTLVSNQAPVPVNYNTMYVTYGNQGTRFNIATTILITNSTGSAELVGTYAEISSSTVSVMMSPKFIDFAEGQNTTVGVNAGEPTTIPDAYWSAMAAALTFYYID